MKKYQLNKSKYGTHSLIANEIQKNLLILDIGCNEGYLQKLAPENSFFGIDNNLKNIKKAKKKYKKVFYKNLNEFKSINIKEKFDLIIFADILEHLMEPEKVLEYFIQKNLKKNGKIIISLPNIANIAIRLKLLFGKFDYTKNGILDKNHLHFYTLESANKFIKSCNLKIIKTKFSSNNFGKIIKFIPFLKSLLGYNLIFLCKTY